MLGKITTVLPIYTRDKCTFTHKSVTASHQINSNEAARYANDQDPTTKWCVGSNQSQTPWLQYIMPDTVIVNRWMVLGAVRERGDYVAKSFKLQYLAEDGTWVDADIVEGNQVNKVVRTLPQPITTTRVRLQMIQGEQNAYTTRIYEFAVFGYIKGEDPVGIRTTDNGQQTTDDGQWYDLSGCRIVNSKLSNSKFGSGVYIHNGRKELW